MTAVKSILNLCLVISLEATIIGVDSIVIDAPDSEITSCKSGCRITREEIQHARL